MAGTFKKGKESHCPTKGRSRQKLTQAALKFSRIMEDKINYTVAAEAVTWEAVRATGPGGQNVNKVATAVQLRFALFRAGLPQRMTERFTALFAARLTVEGELILRSQTERTQGANLRLAKMRLKAMLDAAAAVPKVRRATRPTRASKERRLKAKAVRSVVKRLRRSSVDPC